MALTASQKKVLIAINKWRALGFQQIERDLVAVLSGYTNKKEGFKKILSQLKKGECISFPAGDMLSLTGSGIDEAGGDILPMTNGEMQAFIRSELLKTTEIRVFDYLLGMNGIFQSRDGIMRATDYESKPEDSFDYETCKGK